ncbi:uncharacterized protein L969DRAFT_91911 [Mixia osmundae IAM 14324]|uniref:TauD/TfdA-like domain-containing protein n=1 Tax=Mixia osmundae (strain CBS 9802 / IAM 14324 / JCM 22182 / KY 12970) TaxID=764103 RepID=G7E360_MIXOS|nr:uncharacterized protein L969DRAFT_91911 [Mixia osmundae IAM 14324]KEI42471.1 hypothetical protein L969DRAFT_91911 [Mixia osmundae IAM 14324]GAA97241.1 hypothetical protein E5Q_03918 [Mixia osmundae IAM 14324]
MSTQTIHKLSLRAGTADTSIDEKFKKDLHLFPTYAQGVAREPDYAFDAWLPRPDPSLHYEPLTDFEHVDPGTRVPDPLTNPLDELLKNAQTAEITPAIGTEVSGVQLSTLSPAQKDQLSVLAARRGVLIFREQDFQELSVPDALDWARYFGRLHIHPTSAHPEGYPEVHLVYRDRKSSFNYEKSDRTNSVTWHSDVSYETQPPGLTSLFLFSSPESGGDTLFVNTAKAYERLSPEFRERLHGLQVVHSGHEQANYLRRDGKRGAHSALLDLPEGARRHGARLTPQAERPFFK